MVGDSQDEWPEHWWRDDTYKDAWASWHKTLLDNIFEIVMPPAAMGSGARSAAHKASLLVYSWALGSTTKDLRAVSKSYISFTSDMGVELSLAEYTCSDPWDFLPSWMALMLPTADW